MSERTTVALPKKDRPAVDLLAEQYRQEKHLLVSPSSMDTLVYAIRECLERRGITFLPAPDGVAPVPVFHVQFGQRPE
jgi:hypothetical protein